MMKYNLKNMILNNVKLMIIKNRKKVKNNHNKIFIMMLINKKTNDFIHSVTLLITTNIIVKIKK